jgi:hypothetical protein
MLSSLLPATEPEQQAAAQVKDLAMEKGSSANFVVADCG